MLSRIQEALNTIFAISQGDGVSVNVQRTTILPLTKKERLDKLVEPIHRGGVAEFKYLGLTLD